MGIPLSRRIHRLVQALFLIALFMTTGAASSQGQSPVSNPPIVTSAPLSPKQSPEQSSDQSSDRASLQASNPSDDDNQADTGTEGCSVRRITTLPGSHQFASDFIEAIAGDPAPGTPNPDTIWALTADLSNAVPPQNRAMYISKSTDGGAAWTLVARLDSRYFDARIGEGLRNGFSVAPGAAYFVVTTQRGAFQIFPQPGGANALIKPIVGPMVPYTPPKVTISKKGGDPVRANALEMTADGRRLIIGYGYFDLSPQIFSYHKGSDGSWIDDGPIPALPTEMDILSMAFDDPHNPNPGYLYVGTGDQVYLLNLRSMHWSQIEGVGPDSAIHGMSVVGGLHVAACWGVYNPTGPGSVRRVINARFLLHPTSDESGSNLRAYSIEVDPSATNREIVTSITGVYTSEDSGQTWRRINDLPEGEYRTAHFNANGTVLVSGMPGTFLIQPFSDSCSPHLRTRPK